MGKKSSEAGGGKDSLKGKLSYCQRFLTKLQDKISWKQETGNKCDNQNETKPVQCQIWLSPSWIIANEEAHVEEFSADQPGQ